MGVLRDWRRVSGWVGLLQRAFGWDSEWLGGSHVGIDIWLKWLLLQ